MSALDKTPLVAPNTRLEESDFEAIREEILEAVRDIISIDRTMGTLSYAEQKTSIEKRTESILKIWEKAQISDEIRQKIAQCLYEQGLSKHLLHYHRLFETYYSLERVTQRIPEGLQKLDSFCFRGVTEESIVDSLQENIPAIVNSKKGWGDVNIKG